MSPLTERANSEEMETNYPNFDDPEIVDTHEGNDDDYFYDDYVLKLNILLLYNQHH